MRRVAALFLLGLALAFEAADSNRDIDDYYEYDDYEGIAEVTEKPCCKKMHIGRGIRIQSLNYNSAFNFLF